MSKTLDEYLFQNVNLKEHIVATYRVRAKDNDFLDAARKIAIGQSIGNPDIRTERDSPELLRENLAKITGVVKLNDNEGNTSENLRIDRKRGGYELHYLNCLFNLQELEGLKKIIEEGLKIKN